MSLSFGQNEPLSCPKNAIFGGVIGVYFVSFFLEHPVEEAVKQKKNHFYSFSYIDVFHLKRNL